MPLAPRCPRCRAAGRDGRCWGRAARSGVPGACASPRLAAPDGTGGPRCDTAPRFSLPVLTPERRVPGLTCPHRRQAKFRVLSLTSFINRGPVDPSPTGLCWKAPRAAEDPAPRGSAKAPARGPHAPAQPRGPGGSCDRAERPACRGGNALCLPPKTGSHAGGASCGVNPAFLRVSVPLQRLILGKCG